MIKWVEYLRFLIKTKGFIGLFLRLHMLVNRFDLSGNKLMRAISEIQHIGKKYAYRPAILIPAVILKRYNHFLCNLSKDNLEFGIHGYSHKNYKQLTLDHQIEQIHNAKEIFKAYQVPFYGFRAPYLSWNNLTIRAVQENSLLWESDESFIWNGFIKTVSKRHFHEKAIQRLYQPSPADSNLLIPRIADNIVRIPITLPDDEIMIDRYTITEPGPMESIWSAILTISHQRGYIFALHLHPERFFICRSAMEGLLHQAKHFKPPVWITGMKEVAEWWKEKAAFRIEFHPESDRGYTVKCECSDRATILGRNLKPKSSTEHFYQDYQLISQREFFVESGNRKPCIGVHPQNAQSLIAFLENEGFPYDVSDHDSNYSFYLSGHTTFNRDDEYTLLKKIERARCPIVRYWRWPTNTKSAFVTTHDLDCISLKDFLLRPFER